jgi:hypothetical protein
MRLQIFCMVGPATPERQAKLSGCATIYGIAGLVLMGALRRVCHAANIRGAGNISRVVTVLLSGFGNPMKPLIRQQFPDSGIERFNFSAQVLTLLALDIELHL